MANRSLNVSPAWLAVFLPSLLYSCAQSTTVTGLPNSSVNCTNSSPTIVSWWDGSSINPSSNQAVDRITTSNNNGALINVSTASGHIGNAFNFGSAGSSILVPNSSSLSQSSAITVMGWVNSNASSRSTANQAIFSKWGYNPSSSLSSSSSWQGVNIDQFSGNPTGSTTAWSSFQKFNGSVFDGRYVYFIPFGTTSGAPVTRFDTQGTFSASSSWQGVNLTNFSGNAPDGTSWSSFGGFDAAVFDGRYVYLVPARIGSNYVSTFARFDTLSTSGFSSQSSWSGVNVGGFSGNPSNSSQPWSNYKGYVSGIFDGRYIYFASEANGTVLQYDTQAASGFTSVSSWNGINFGSDFSGTPSGLTVSWSSFQRFGSSTFDGRYVYLVPYTSGYMARYDTQSNNFTSTNGWAAADFSEFSGNIPGSLFAWSSLVGTTSGGFTASFFDGTYLYLLQDTPSTSTLVRYTVSQPINSASSYTAVSLASFSGNAPGTSTAWTSFVGLSDINFDGRYIYLIPFLGGSSTYVGTIAQYDTLSSAGFTSSSSWAGVNFAGFSGTPANSSTNWSSFTGYWGSAFDGRYLYLAPSQNGNVARYDAVGSQGSYSLKYATTSGNGYGNSLPGPSFTINTSNSPVTVQSYSSFTSGGWHHVAATYDTNSALIYVDGVLTGAQSGTGNIVTNTSAANLGSILTGTGAFEGLIDDVQVFGSALSAANIKAIYTATASATGITSAFNAVSCY